MSMNFRSSMKDHVTGVEVTSSSIQSEMLLMNIDRCYIRKKRRRILSDEVMPLKDTEGEESWRETGRKNDFIDDWEDSEARVWTSRLSICICFFFYFHNREKTHGIFLYWGCYWISTNKIININNWSVMTEVEKMWYYATTTFQLCMYDISFVEFVSHEIPQEFQS